MAKRYAMLEKKDEMFIIRYPMEKRNDYAEEKFEDNNIAIERLVRMVTLFALFGDIIYITAPKPYHGRIKLWFSNFSNRVIEKSLKIRIKDLDDQ